MVCRRFECDRRHCYKSASPWVLFRLPIPPFLRNARQLVCFLAAFLWHCDGLTSHSSVTPTRISNRSLNTSSAAVMLKRHSVRGLETEAVAAENEASFSCMYIFPFCCSFMSPVDLSCEIVYCFGLRPYLGRPGSQQPSPFDTNTARMEMLSVWLLN